MNGLRYRAVVFDLDGTLVDSYTALAKAVNHARSLYGLSDLGLPAIRQFVGHGVETLLRRAFQPAEVPPGAQEAFERFYDSVCCAESRVLDEVAETLEELEQLGMRMSVCTNKPTSFSRKILEFLDLARHFRAIIGPDLAGARKPDARHLLHTLAASGCDPGEALFVGDMPVDVEAARNSGIAVAVVATGSSSLAELLACKPDHVLDRFSDLISLMRRGAVA